MAYSPSQKILEKYADVLVNFALGGGEGIKTDQVVRLVGAESTKPLYAELYRTILKAGGHVIGNYLPDEDGQYNLSRDFYNLATTRQLDFFPAKYYRGLVDTIDHTVAILSETDKQALEGVAPAKIMRSGIARKPYGDWLESKEDQGRYTWTLALYGTEAMAKEAGLSLRDYWGQIIKACFLDEAKPINKWRHLSAQIEQYRQKLNRLPIQWLHITGPDADLKIKLGQKRQWMHGSGRNIPSFEIFTSPDWRGTEGWIRFNQPLYRYGNLIEDIELKFKAGKVIAAQASKNQPVLAEMIATKGADKIGEFSLTDRRFSRISKFMADTLYDENIGGPYGNTHIALGRSYHDCYSGSASRVTKKGWQSLGFNDSSVHTDIISTTDRTVTATLRDGSEKVIYQNGCFKL